ncbi:MAG TPA: benzoate-CoA ligase family protein [Acidimicrobiales bacterium]|nr:benzoate-CoA ligase family protein [Acidimicrobiales bacterium]
MASGPANAACWLLDRHLEEGRGGTPAIMCEERTLTYGDLFEASMTAANGLAALGAGRGDRVMLVLEDTEAFPAFFLGAIRAGVVPVPVSTMLTAGEHAAIAADAGASVLVVSSTWADRAAEVVEGAPTVSAVVVAGRGRADRNELPQVAGRLVVGWHDLDDASEAAPSRAAGSDPAFWLYTSGTTGRPKGAIHRHASLRATADTYARTVLAATAQDRFYSVAKLFFAYGLGNSLTFPLAVGGLAVLEPAPSTPALVAANLSRHRPSLFFASPGFCAAMLDAGVPADSLSSVRLVVTAGEALPAEVHDRFVEAYGVTVLDGIGTTEALHIFCSNRVGAVRTGTSGTVVDGYDMRLVDDEGLPVTASDVPGHLQLRGPSLAAGYWQRPDVTAAAFGGGWLRTGDVYSRSDDGYWRFHGRGNDMIKAGGIWVSPAEVENVLLSHPDVLEAAVVGSRDERGLEVVVAFVVPRSGARVEEGALGRHCREHMAAFKRPRRFVVLDGLPKTATGKIQRHVLRERLAGKASVGLA